ncbi:putative ankyrin repeat domain containing protein [Phaeoacremonium minimum UCRPA7]|uniref:Putative ankyrin repeat domain containing protein n=1 Tax=Phaeoacremonium minimum (strain UCR-PA7) TaxID=1286976 RepID=R8BVI9_PHAM7|nr:putative ankyrin repeat domain containing protein [Phaeoacremonium minimum UCRPA7]EOO03340.1 putative ankyrin repeat domain containing protein [Phaeoacremonium minimum UCRPA7]
MMGNSISVRMLEYLSTVKNHPHGFRELAMDFLDICRILWSIEAGLTEASRTHNQFPSDMVQELDKKFRQTNDDFIVLNQMLVKYLEYEKKGGFARLQKGWRMMFADTNIHKMRESLAKSRDALRMSALVFRWSLGDAKANSNIGIGYTGLAAALERMNTTRPTTVIPPVSAPISERDSAVDMGPHSLHSRSPHSTHDGPELPPQLPPMSILERTSASDLIRDTTHHSGAYPERQGSRLESRSIASTRSSKVMQPSVSAREVSIRDASLRDVSVRDHRSASRNGSLQPEGTIRDIRDDHDDLDDRASINTTETETLIEDMIQELELNDNTAPTQVTRIKADLTTVPRWTPRHSSGANSAGLRAALMNAVHQKKHKMIEQLLDRGVPPDTGPEINILREAVLNRDPETTRLLLLFGADANGFDKDGFTPLYSATELSFLEGAKMLIKYGADPNLSAGPESESPLAMAVSENKLEFVQLYLMYGGDPNHVMANGNTVFIKAMNKSTPKRLVELMLNYGSDPNGKNGEGKSPLFEAISVQRVDLMTVLLDRGANPNLPGPKHLLWPAVYHPQCLSLLLSRGAEPRKCPGIMELATSINNLESVRVLLKAGVNPNAKKDGVYTPLCSAIRDNRGEIVTLLLANGADPNVMASEYPCFKCVTHHRAHLLPQVVAAGGDLNNPKGIIEKAVEHNNKEALMYLLDAGVSPNDKAPEGFTPLTTAIREDRGEFVDLLLARGADPAIRGQDWPICMAVKRPNILKKLLPSVENPRAFKGVMEMAVVANQLESIKLLLQAGVSVEDKNGGVFSPLTTAIREDRKEITRFLLEEGGADVNAPGEHLPLIKAIRRFRGDTEYIEMLLERGADINLMYRGWNAVLQAVENGDAQILKLLVEKGNGVDLQAKDESGRTVMEVVQSRGWDEAVTILLGNGADARR